LRAYRCWRVEWQDGQPVLGSLFHSTIWPADRPLRATCEKRSGWLSSWVRRCLSRSVETHPAPAWGCECGIYAMARLEDDEDLKISPHVFQRGPLDRVMRVAGVAQLWGRVVQHDRGYRAEYARVLKLLTVPSLVRVRDSEGVLEAIARRYRIPLVTCAEDLSRAA
jgi:hypothetical protein